MKFYWIYRASFYLMLTFATLVLSIDAADDNRYAMLYPMVVAVACFAAFLTVDRNPRLALSRSTANLLGIATLVPAGIEFYHDDNLLLLAAAHWLVYLQLVKIFLPKTVMDDWYLFLLGLVQVLVGGVMSQSDKVGIALFVWALLSLWVLTLFSLHREALRTKNIPMGSSLTGGGDRSEPYRGLIDFAFLWSSVRVAATTLALGGLIFLAMPRRTSMGTSQSSGTIGKHLTGFDTQVKLGELGEILENDSPVMSIELVDQDGSRRQFDENIEWRWRGVSMDRYERGHWYRPQYNSHDDALGFADRRRTTAIVRQLIKLEPNDSPVLFGLRPILGADSNDKQFSPQMNEKDGTLFRTDTRVVTLDYTVDSSTSEEMVQYGEMYPGKTYLASLKRMPDELQAKLRPIALKLVKGIPEDDLKSRASTLEHYLRESGEFVYSLQMEVVDPNLDPVEDFLVNRKSGHCEYFASALALLLRSIDIPSRMINGFKGGDYNAMAGITTVRQKHAHSWVEVLVGRTEGKGNDSKPLWMVLDPTPTEQRNQSVAKVGGMAAHFYQLTDLIRYVWIFYIVGFNSDRQDRFLYGPIRELVKEAQRGFGIIFETIRSWLHFPSMESFFSFRGFVVSFVGLLLLVGLARLLTWQIGRLIGKFSGSKDEDSPGMVGVQFYRRLVNLLAEYGLERPPAETPREFARRAAIFLSGHGSGTEAVADVPPLVVDAFYQIRFGEHTIREDDFEHVTARLNALEEHLHPSKP
jgi:protein-glutamine gamma-glutamyltransferase